MLLKKRRQWTLRGWQKEDLKFKTLKGFKAWKRVIESLPAPPPMDYNDLLNAYVGPVLDDLVKEEVFSDKFVT